MNNSAFIGNLTNEPETRYTQSGTNVCSFGIAVNKRGANGEQQATFVRVSAFGKRGEVIQQYAHKGNKIYVAGEISAHAYAAADGKPRASLELLLNEFEFLTSKSENGQSAGHAEPDAGFTAVETDELPF